MEKSFTLRIEGMHCDGCVRRVSKALTETAGVTVDSVEVGSAKIRLSAGTSDAQAAADAVSGIGFQASVVEA